MSARSVRLDEAAPLFVNGEDNRLTRFGVRYIVAHRVAEAAKICPSLLTRKVTPHTWRHTTAMHLLQSNVDLSMIRSWLGHASIETTNTYVEIDLEMKRKTLQSCEKLLPAQAKAALPGSGIRTSFRGFQSSSYVKRSRSRRATPRSSTWPDPARIHGVTLFRQWTATHNSGAHITNIMCLDT